MDKNAQIFNLFLRFENRRSSLLRQNLSFWWRLHLLKKTQTKTLMFPLSPLRFWRPWLTDTLLLLPPAQLGPPTPCPDRVTVLPAVDWSTLIGGFARWFFGLAPPPPGAGVRSQQPVVPCAPPSPSLHNRAHAQGETRTCSSSSVWIGFLVCDVPQTDDFCFQLLSFDQ